MVRGFAICAVVLVSATLVGSAVGHPGDGDGAGEAVTWTLSATQCAQLPAGITVNGTGTKTVTFKSLVKKGKRLDAYMETATGTATDSAGATYTWNYAFSSITSGKKAPFKGVAIDHFQLIAQNGPVAVHAFFIANVSIDANDVPTLTPTLSVGDPLDFASGAPHCDAL
jgi:hypothetical protein